MPRKSPDPESFLPLKPVVFQILVALVEQEHHGYGIMQAVRKKSEYTIRLETGPFYRHLKKLIDLGLIEDSPKRPAGADQRRGTYYRLTRLGREAAAAENRRLVDLVKLTKRLGLAG